MENYKAIMAEIDAELETIRTSLHHLHQAIGHKSTCANLLDLRLTDNAIDDHRASCQEILSMMEDGEIKILVGAQFVVLVQAITQESQWRSVNQQDHCADRLYIKKLEKQVKHFRSLAKLCEVV